MPKHKWNINPITLTIPSLGPVLFVQSTRAKRLSITIKPDQTVKVTIPTRVSLTTAKKFLQSKIPWAKKNLNKLQELQQDYPQINLLPINRTRAKTVLTERLNLLAHKYSFSYNKLFLRNQKTRWGSCSSKNNISLNMNLVRLPQELRDYVILHELVHTKHKNHSKKFWAEMDRIVGDGKKLKREMGEYRLGDVNDTSDVGNEMNPSKEAIFYITKWYPHIGAGNTSTRIPGLSSPYEVMIKAAGDMLQMEPSDAFPDRHKEHIAYALKMVASGGFLSSAAAVGSVYLATRFEFYFRVLSGRLKADGTWKTDKDQQALQNLLAGVRGLEKPRINSVALAYKIMKTNTDLPLAQICNDLDKMLYPKRIEMPDGKIVSDIGDRIEYLRHRSAHGHWGDISGDANFYGLMTVIVFYNQR